MKNLLIAQSGGPTAAINATMLGVVESAMQSGQVSKIYGGMFGILGILESQIKEIGQVLASPESMSLLEHTPASALGSCRRKLIPADYEKIIAVLRAYDIGYFVYIGGNDSMDTVLQLSLYCKAQNINDIKIMGAPKTIDNDLCVTDHTPGFGSAAKYIATSISELFCDIRVYNMPAVTIVEMMGRDTGWLAAASCLSGVNGGESPHLIYLPECPFSEENFLADVRTELELASDKGGYIMVVVSEGLRDDTGEYICEKASLKATDAFGHKFLSGTAKYLEQLVQTEIGCKARSIELNLLQRCAAHMASATDLSESKMLGAAAFLRALHGGSGEMSIIKRVSQTPYQIAIETTPIENVANEMKTVPLEWLNEKRNNVNQHMIDYLFPLIQGECRAEYRNGIPVHIRL